MVLLLVGLLSTTLQAAAQQRFLNTKTTTKYAAIGLVKEPLDGVTRVIGAVKRSDEPLMQQTEKWEARCDNGVYARACVHVALRSFPLIAQSKLIHVCPRGWRTGYPNVLHNPEDPHGAFRLWYGCFTSGTDFATSQGSVSGDLVPLTSLPLVARDADSVSWRLGCAQDRTNGWLYANSSDGIRWEKPALGVYDLAKGPEGKKPGYAALGTKNNIVLGTPFSLHYRKP